MHLCVQTLEYAAVLCLLPPQDLIGLVEDHYNFLDHLEEMEESSMDDDESSLFRYSSNKHSRSHSLENSGDK